MNYSDLKSAINLSTQIDLSFQTLILSLIVSFVCALIIRNAYIRFGKSLNNRDYFSSNFILLAITTTIVITVVKFSFALSLGLVGALSIVRFRAAIKEPEELAYLFLVITIGICNGANQYIAAITLTIFAFVIIFLHNKKTKKVNKYLSNIFEVSISRKKLVKNLDLLDNFLNENCNDVKFKNFSFSSDSIVMTFAVYFDSEKNLNQFVLDLDKLIANGVSVDVIHQVPINE